MSRTTPILRSDREPGPAPVIELPRSRLPIPLTSLVGREVEVDALVALLDQGETRLLTLTGPGGVGKTRLALEVARRMEPDFADGVVYVRLADVHDPAQVIPTIAQSTGVPERNGRSLLNSVVAELRERHLLLALDNFEHLLRAPPAWLGVLLGECPRITVLVTSRLALNIGGERRYQVQPLPVPASGSAWAESRSPAITLFEQRAREVRSSFALDSPNAETVGRICRLLDGLPLAIELVAARVDSLPLTAVLERLTGELRLRAGGRRDAPARQRSMRDTIAWSYDLLSPEEQRVFQQLSVFVGGFTLEAAEAMLDAASTDVVARLSSLVEHSLLRLVDDSAHAPRYFMLETIREYGLEQLAASPCEAAARRRQADWCLGLASQANPFDPSGQLRWLSSLDSEYGNLHAALEWLEGNGRATRMAALATQLRWYWYLAGRDSEGLGWYLKIVERHAELSHLDRRDALLFAGHLARKLGRDDAEGYLTEAHTLARAAGDALREAEAMRYLGLHAKDRGDYEVAEARFRTAGDLYGRVALPWGVTAVEFHLGAVMYGSGKLQKAAETFEATKTRAAAEGDYLLRSLCCEFLALIACDLSNFTQAARMLREETAEAPEMAQVGGPEDLIAIRAVFASAIGRMETAARLFGAVAASENPWTLPERATFERAEATARRHLGDDAWRREWETGRRMRPHEVRAEIDLLLHGEGDHQSPAARTSSIVDALTRREMEVLRLMATGMSNQQIADALFNSKHTIANHVAHILDKLHVDSRTAAVSVAIREKLV